MWGPLGVRIFGLAHQLVRLILRHLAPAHHELNEVAGALDRETRDPGGGADDIFHRGGHFAASFLADLLGARGHLRDRVPDVDPTVAGGALGRCRSG